MKPTFILSLFLLISTISIGQTNQEIFFDIKSKYTLIKELVDNNTLRQYYVSYGCEDSYQNCNLTFYYNGRELKHIIHKYTDELLIHIDKYYVWNDQLFFEISTDRLKYQDHHYYKENNNTTFDQVLSSEKRFYFHNQEPIQCEFKSFGTLNSLAKKSKTTYPKTQIMNCGEALAIIEKYKDVLKYSNVYIKDASILPKSIGTIIPSDVLYSSINKN